MDVRLCMCMEKLCSCHDRRFRYDYTTMGPKRTKYLRENTTEDNGCCFYGNPSKTIISNYSPTNVSEKTDLIAFYNELSSLACSIPKLNILVIGGDMNAQIGKNVNYEFSLLNSLNRNRKHLTDFTQENRLTCLNTKFHSVLQGTYQV